MAGYSSSSRGGIVFNLTGLERKLVRTEEQIAKAAAEAVEELTEVGLRSARYALNAAKTDYGRKRFGKGRGNSAGRNDTGRMISQLRAVKPQVNRGKGTVRASVGWYSASGENKYFDYQENGTSSRRTLPEQYTPSFNYASSYPSGVTPKGGVTGARSLWSARKKMESEKSKYLNKIREAVRKASS